MSNEVVGALDIGGTHVTAGRVDVATGAVEARVRMPFRSSSGSDLVAKIARAAASIADPCIGRLGVAVPGPFDYAAGCSRITHKLNGLYGVDLRSELGEALGLADSASVRFLNDAHAFLLGEWWTGAARGHTRALGVTLGTGLGSAFIDDGRVVQAGFGVAPGGALYELRFRGAQVEDTISSRGLLAAYGATDETIDVENVAARAKMGDHSAGRAFDGLGEALGEFLSPWLCAFEPTCLVVGGSIARSWELLERGLIRSLGSCAWTGTVARAEQLDDAPLLGAARYAVGESS